MVFEEGEDDPKRGEGDELGKTEVALKVSKQALKEQPPLFLCRSNRIHNQNQTNKSSIPQHHSPYKPIAGTTEESHRQHNSITPWL